VRENPVFRLRRNEKNEPYSDLLPWPCHFDAGPGSGLYVKMGIRAEIKNEDKEERKGCVRGNAGATRLTGWNEKCRVFWKISERGALDSGFSFQKRSPDEWESIWGTREEASAATLGLRACESWRNRGEKMQRRAFGLDDLCVSTQSYA
jgi:hypothetical protein